MKKVTGTDREVFVEEDDAEQFLLKQRSQQEIAGYDKGFAAGSKGAFNDNAETVAWRRGWAEAQDQFAARFASCKDLLPNVMETRKLCCRDPLIMSTQLFNRIGSIEMRVNLGLLNVESGT